MLHAELRALRQIAIVGLLGAFVVPMLAGCGGPQPTPIAQRGPGKDISAAARADKRGDVKVPSTN